MRTVRECGAECREIARTHLVTVKSTQVVRELSQLVQQFEGFTNLKGELIAMFRMSSDRLERVWVDSVVGHFTDQMVNPLDMTRQALANIIRLCLRCHSRLSDSKFGRTSIDRVRYGTPHFKC